MIRRCLGTTRCALSPRTLVRPQCRCLATDRKDTIPLAYDLHLPPSKAEYDPAQPTPAVVLMHGLFGSKQSLRSLSRRLAEAIPTQVYTLDLRNHGDSVKQGPLPHSYEHMANDVEMFIKEKNLTNVVIAGHSMGAKVALYLSLTKPQLPKGVISMENSPVRGKLSPTFKKYIDAMKAITDAKLMKRTDAENILAEYEEDQGVRQFLLTNLLPANPSSGKPLRFRIPIDILADSLPSLGDFPLECTDLDCPRYEGPALFIKGTQSGYIQPKHYPLMERMFPKMQVVELDGSHWIHVDQPDGVLMTMSKFVREVS